MHKNKGFTLIEMLIVLLIIGLLATIVIVTVNSSRKEARDAKRTSDLDAVRKALALYKDAYGSYPCQGSIQYPSDGTGVRHIKWNTSTDYPNNWIGAYEADQKAFKSFLDLPNDPTNIYVPAPGNSLRYAYASIDKNEYKIIASYTETAAGQAKANNDGGVLNEWYEIYSPGAQWYHDSLNGVTACLCTKNDSNGNPITCN